MLLALILGLLVSVGSFAVLQFVVLRSYRQYTLPALLLAVGGGLLLALAFPQPLGSFYQLSWMMGMMVCTLIGMLSRSRNRG